MTEETPDTVQTLDRWLDGQRWYGDKGRSLASADPGPPQGGAVFHDTAVWLRAA